MPIVISKMVPNLFPLAAIPAPSESPLSSTPDPNLLASSCGGTSYPFASHVLFDPPRSSQIHPPGYVRFALNSTPHLSPTSRILRGLALG